MQLIVIDLTAVLSLIEFVRIESMIYRVSKWILSVMRERSFHA